MLPPLETSMRPLLLLLLATMALAGCPTSSPDDDDVASDDDDATAGDDDDATGDDDDATAGDDDDATGDDDDATWPDVDAADIVGGGTHTRLVIEIDVVDGHGPDAAALAAFEDAVEDLIASGHIAKPDGFEVVIDDVLPASGDPDKVWTFQEQIALSEDHRDVAAPAGTATIHMLYLDGHSEYDQGNLAVLGYAYGGSWIVMFRDNIDRSCSSSSVLGLLAPSVAQEACAMTEGGVLLHEAGHLFGLVNNGTPMQEPHQDTEHGAHDTNEDCLMYWLAETSSATDVVANRYLGGQTGIPPFDAQCLADLSAVANAR